MVTKSFWKILKSFENISPSAETPSLMISINFDKSNLLN